MGEAGGEVLERQGALDVEALLRVMVFNRLSDPASKLGVLRWLETVYLPGVDREKVTHQHLLRAMDGAGVPRPGHPPHEPGRPNTGRPNTGGTVPASAADPPAIDMPPERPTEEILAELERDNVDIDHLGAQVKRAVELIQVCREKLEKTDVYTADELAGVRSTARPRNVSQYKIVCPACSGELAFQEGCVKCHGCGFSQC